VLSLEELYKGTTGGETVPKSGPAPAKGVNVWWVSCGMSIPACAVPAKAAEAAAHKLGWQYHIADGKLNENGGNLTALRTAIAAKPSAIIIHGISCPVITAGLAEAKAQKIPVMGVESMDCSEEGKGGQKLYSVGMKYAESAPTAADYFKEWGVVGASYVIDTTSSKAQFIEEEPTEAGLQTTISGAFNELIALCKECKKLTTIKFTSADYTPGGILAQGIKTALVKYPQANVVWTPFESAVEGGEASAAIEKAGLKAKVAGCCGAGAVPLFNLIREGKWTGASAHSAVWMGWGAMDELNRVFNKEETVPEGIGQVLVTKEHNLPATGAEYSPSFSIPAEYAKLWKVG
jgi:ribose transport system substrate-binding protein